MNAFDALLVLGVKLCPDGAPTPELQARADAAASALEGLPEGVPAVLCGGRSPGCARAEAEALKDLLVARGVPETRIRLESQSRDTMENFRFAAGLLGSAKGKRVLVVTSDYHMRRALLTARRVGFSAKGAAARLPHDAAWHTLRRKELCFTLDLLMGWQDEGRSRPQIANRLFELAFGPRKRG